MEIIIGYVMIAAIMLFMGFSLLQVGILTLLIIGFLVALIGVFFAVCLAMLAFSRVRRGVFVRFDEDLRFPCAVYRLGTEEVANMFPCEMIMRDKLYNPEKQVTLLYCKPRRKVFDKNALFTIIIGSFVFIPAGIFSVVAIVGYIRQVVG